MTSELARSAASLASVSQETQLRLRRLERLRALDPTLRPAADLHRPEPRPRPTGDRAEHLAAALGGTVERIDGGAIVVVERTQALPFDPRPLASLPFPVDPRHPLLLLDTETTGLGTAAGTLCFLVGLAQWEGDLLRVTQLWLPDHAAEAALLRALDRRVPPESWLVTYNGRTFDWPLLVTRYRLQGRHAPVLAGHLDLLPVARQLWRHRLPDARLASVEAGVAGLHRHRDLPGALVPERFFSYLRGAPPAQLVQVGHHNRADVVAMAHLLRVLADRFATPEGRRGVHPGDVAGLGRALRRRGRHEEAVECLRLAVDSSDAPGVRNGVDRPALMLESARLFVRLGRYADAEQLWKELVASGGGPAILARIAHAKHLEHRGRDPRGALAVAESAVTLLDRRRALGWFMPEAERDLAKRIRRLRRRVARGRHTHGPGTGGQAPDATFVSS